MRKVLILLFALCPLFALPLVAPAEQTPAIELDPAILEEAAIDAALPAFELAEVLERLMPYEFEQSGYLSWEFFHEISGIYWPLTPERLRELNRDKISGRVKLRAAGKIFSDSVFGFPREVPWNISAYALNEVGVSMAKLQPSTWGPQFNGSGADFDIEAALTLNPRLEAEKVDTRHIGPIALTGYILRAEGRRPIIMEFNADFLQNHPFPIVLLYYPLSATPDIVRLLLDDRVKELGG